MPFVHQEKNGCGSASIWMVMNYWQPDVTLDVGEIQSQLYSKQAGGIYAKDMQQYFEAHGYRAFALRGSWSDLTEQISKGRPLIVSLERNSRGLPLHYVVVAGFDSIQNLVLVNDPAERKLLSMSRSDFERVWQATDYWTLLAVPELNLASTAFRDENLPEARNHLESALHVNPSDAYTNEFLATVYFLQNDTEAALKYWNHAGKPGIENIRIDPPLRLDPILLDRAFAFSRGETLRLSDFEDTQARLAALGVLTRYRMDLSPATSERFDVTLRGAERSGTNVWSWARGLPFQTIELEFPNIARKAINLGGRLRWDSNKRRAFLSFEAPLHGDPKWGLRTNIDARDEMWASSSGGFHMQKVQAAAELHAVPSGRWSWTSGASISNRHFSNSFSSGLELKYSGSVTRTLVREPSRHFRIDSTATAEAGKLFGVYSQRFTKLMHTTDFQWRSATSKVRLGTAMGQVPFDERFMIGLDRDSDLWLRAHPAIVDGRKDASNTSRAFVITNSDVQKTLIDKAWFRISAGPFLDTGKSSVSRRWLADTGVELRLSVLGSFGIKISYGKSLSDTRHSLFIREDSQ